MSFINKTSPIFCCSGVSGGNWTQKPPGQPVMSKPAQPPSATATGSAVQMQPNGLQSLSQLNALNAAAAAGYRLPSQLTAQQLQQLQLQQQLRGGGAAAASPMTSAQLQQLIQAGLIGGTPSNAAAAAAVAAANQSVAAMRGATHQQLNFGGARGSAVDMAALARQQQQQQQQQRAAVQQSAVAGGNNRTFPGKLTQIKEFPMERSNQPPYKLQKALIDQKIVPCINVRPYVFHDLMMTLPDFVKHFFPDLPLEKCREMLQEILKVVLYKGNT